MGTWTPGPGPTEGNDRFDGSGNDDDVVDGLGGDDVLRGVFGNDTLHGGAGNDLLVGGSGADTMVGGVGDDEYQVGDNQDTIVELVGEGHDRIHVFLSLATYSIENMAGIEDLYVDRPDGAGAVFAVGNDNNNVITANNILSGPYVPTNDILYGRGGNDHLAANFGDDTLYGEEGDDYLSGGDGADMLIGGEGEDTVDGNIGDDIMIGGEGDDQMIGGAGNDVFRFAAGDIENGEIIRGGDGNDVLEPGEVNTLALNGDLDFRLTLVRGVSMIVYESAGSASFSHLLESAIPGDLTIQGSLGINVFSLELTTSFDLSTIDFVDWSTEDLVALSGFGVLTGSSGRDQLIGSLSNDTLNGGDGNDALSGGIGADQLDGGAGVDTADYSMSTGAVSINLNTGSSTGGDAAGDTFANVEAIIGSALADQITGSAADDTLTGGAGNDELAGLGGADTLNGGDGDDVLYGHSEGATGAITSAVLASGIDTPVCGSTAPGDEGFLYIVEKATGVIWRVDENTGARTQFLDIPNTAFSSQSERGVLGLAFHPDYETNGRFFVFLTDPQGDLTVREYSRGAGDPPVANTASTLVIEVPHPGESNHNGGWIGFSPTDGYLYITTGDGGGGGDPNNNAQNLNSLLGKMLRIDVNSDGFPADANRNYAIPAGNPFAGATAGADEIWAYGLRNPWRAAFDPRNGDLYIGDVGQGAREEIDYAESGAGGLNFGWRLMEGNEPYPPGSPDPGVPGLTAPIFDYPRDVGTTVTGGEVYVGPNSDFVGQYVFADFGSGRLFTLSVVDGEAVHVTDRTAQITGAMPSSIVDFVTGADGRLYAIGIGGTVWRLDMGQGAEDVGDTLNGGAGSDQIFGGIGDDTLAGGTGNDLVQGGTGADIINYAFGDGADAIDGGAGADTLNFSGNTSENTLSVSFNGATLTGANSGTITSVETINADLGAGTDWLIYTATAAVVVNLTTGAASGFASLANFENVIAGSGNDSMTGSAINNRLDGGQGNDAINGAGGNDILIGGAGVDTLSGGLAGDSLDGGAGNDTLAWAWGEGADTLNGGADSDTLNATGSGADNLLRATWNGAAITNLFDSVLLSLETLNVDMSGGTDWLIYTATGAVSIDLGAGTATGFSSLLNVENAVGGSGGDTLTGSALANRLDGGLGADTLNGAAGADILIGGDGVDTLVGGLGNDSMQGGAGADTFTWAWGDGRDTFNGGADSDTLNAIGSGAENIVRATWNGAAITALFDNALVSIEAINLDMGGGPDWLIYNASTGVSVNLGAGTASGFASIASVENVIGGTGNDTLTGNASSNKLTGGDGADALTGGAGGDILTGGLGADTFIYAAGAGTDTITDFDAAAVGGQDFIDVTAFGITSGDFSARIVINDIGAHTVVTIDSAVAFTLTGVTGDGANVVTQDDFILA